MSEQRVAENIHKDYYDIHLLGKKLNDYSIEDFKELLLLLCDYNVCPDITYSFEGYPDEYYSVAYSSTEISFGRCSYNNDFQEKTYSSIDELLDGIQIDGICLRRDWSKLKRLSFEPDMDQFTADEVIEAHTKHNK